MVESRPDWVISRQRAWGVPITVFIREQDDGSVEILNDARVNKRIADAFEQEGADAWYATGAARALPQARLRFQRVAEGRRHSRRLVRLRLDARLRRWKIPALPVARRHQAQEGRRPRHRDVSRRLRPAPRLVPVLAARNLRHARRSRPSTWCSPTASCSTRTARKMSKSLGNVIGAAGRDQAVRRRHSAACGLRASDYADDLRIGPEILKTTVETYRKLRNTLRWMLGSLAHFRDEDRVAPARHARARAADAAPARRARRPRAPGLCRLRLQAHLRRAQRVHDLDLSAFYFDIRKDALYCDPISSTTRKASLTVLDAAVSRHGDLARADAAVHRRGGLARALSVRGRLRASRAFPRAARRLARRRAGGEMAQGAHRAARRHRRDRDRAGAEAHRLLARGRRPSSTCPTPTCSPRWWTSTWRRFRSPRRRRWSRAKARRTHSASTTSRASRSRCGSPHGTKCARSWKILPSVGSDPAYPDVSPRDAQALREWEAMRKAAE